MSDIPVPPRFVSLRWRTLLPLAGGLALAVALGAYALGASLASAVGPPQRALLEQVGRDLTTRAGALYEAMRLQAQRVAFTPGVVMGDAAALQPLLEGAARLDSLDSVLVLNADGREVLGLLRADESSAADFSLSTDTDLRQQAVVRAVLDEGYIGASGLVQTTRGLLLAVGVPLTREGNTMGVVVVGHFVEQVLMQLQGAIITDVGLYGPRGELLALTRGRSAPSGEPAAPVAALAQVNQSGRAAATTLDWAGAPYQAALLPFQFGPQRLGALAALLPDRLPAMIENQSLMGGLVFAALALTALSLIVLLLYRRVITPVQQITGTAQALAAGQVEARTGLQPVDEVRAVGAALDEYANVVQAEHDALEQSLRRQRREYEFILGALESLPHGVFVQDRDGAVIVMNEQARRWLETDSLPELSAFSAAEPEALLAPGLYTLGDPRRMEQGGRLLQAEAAALLNLTHERVGTVVLMQDITSQVQATRIQERLLAEWAAEAPPRGEAPAFEEAGRSLTRHTMMLQKLIGEMRELTLALPNDVISQRPLYLEALVWSVANEWRQVAAAMDISLEVKIDARGLYVLGDERRLRLAIGNIVDNAIKYTLPGGRCSLEVNGESQGRALLRVRDSGVGIAPEDLPQVFTRYFRGTPRTADGRVIRLPGTGQGLSIAQHLIEAHGGLIQIKSKVGVGTAVYFALPLTSGVVLPLSADFDLEGETVRVAPLRRERLL